MSEVDMVEVKTAGLIGPALDWAVAQVEGVDYRQDGIKCKTRLAPRKWSHYTKPNFSPSTDWSWGGPLIDKHMLNVKPHASTNGVITSWSASMAWPCETMPGRCGKTSLIAACRAIVTKELGETIQVPKELMQ